MSATINKYRAPYKIDRNREYPNLLVTLFDADGGPMLTTHDEGLAVLVCELLNERWIEDNEKKS